MSNLPNVNIASREFKTNPYPFYARLRAEAPVYRTILPDKQVAWLITRYDDVMMVLKDDRRFVKNPVNAMTPAQLKKLPWVPPVARPLTHNLLNEDWTDHARLRGLVHKAFTPRMIEDMRGRVQSLANGLLDSAERKGKFDLIADYALPIPLIIITEILGVPQKDAHRFHRWIKWLLDLSAGGSINALRGLPALWMMVRYFRRMFKERSANPQGDLITALVQAEDNGVQLSADELLSLAIVLIIAGHETTVNLIGSGALGLLEYPDQMRLLRQKPELLKNTVEELLRYASPVEQATERYAAEDITLHGVTIPKGEMVLAVLASANRDENVFPNPNILDITRDNLKHTAFGMGAHYCVGAPLARLEGQIAIQTLVERLPGLMLQKSPDKLRWRAGMTVRGLEALPVAMG